MIPSSLLNWLHRELESAVSSSLEGVVFWVVRKFVDLTVVDSESGSNLKVILIADRDIAFSRLSVTRDDDKSINQSINQSLFKHGKIHQEFKN